MQLRSGFTMKRRCAFAVLCFVATLSILPIRPATAGDLSTVEQLYAKLAGLPADQRSARLIEGAKSEGKLALIQTLPAEYDKTLIPAFLNKYPFVKMDVTRIGSQDGPERIIAEESAGRHLTDVIVNALPDSTGLIERNMAARYPTPAVTKILSNYQGFIDHGQKRWTPIYWSEYGMSYNSDLVSAADAPKEWFDLCKPRFKGSFRSNPIRSSSWSD